MKYKVLLLVVGAVALMAAPANAVITFDEFPEGTVISNQYASYGVVFEGGDINGNLPKITPDGAMATEPVLAGDPPYNTDFYMRFLAPTYRVSFISGYWDAVGSGAISVYGWGGGLLGTVTNPGLGVQSFSFTYGGGIGRIHFDPSADPAGADIDNLDIVVPEPGTLFLLGTGLAGLGAAYRRRRSAKK